MTSTKPSARGARGLSSASTTTEFQQRINERIDEFVADITQLARDHAMATLADALSDPASSGKPSSRARRDSRPGGRHKRTQAELDSDKKRLLAAICTTPGQRMLDLAPILEMSAKQLALPARQLISEKLVRTEGQKRSTAYFPTARGRKAPT